MFPNQLKLLRGRRGLSQKGLAELIGFSQQSIGKWETGTATPSPDVIVKIAELFKVSTDYLLMGIDNLPPTLRGDEKRLLRLYNDLDFSGRRLLMVNTIKAVHKNKENRDWFEKNRALVAKLMIESFGEDWGKLPESVPDSGAVFTLEDIDSLPDFEDDDSPYPLPREVPVYFQPASAGTGTFLDSHDYDIMEFPFDEVPIKTTFGVRISGDSMEPEYLDGDIVFVRQQPTVEPGEIGIFILDTNSYIKKLSSNGKTAKLVSLNPKYSPIIVGENDAFKPLGKVIGVAKKH